MREIKFRAWQSHSSLHRKPGMYDVTSLELYDESGGGEAFLALPGENARSSEYLEDIKLMQYTGFEDKNGVEIYEGDVLRCTADVPGMGYTTAVSWRNAAWCTATENLADCMEDEFEVIGNIYEDLEQLTTA